MKPIKAGDLLGQRYKVLSTLGEGGMGIVFLVEDAKMKRQLAVKVLKDVAQKKERVRITREAKNCAKLDHPNIVKVFDVFEHEGLPCIAMEYIDGKDLKHLIDEGLSINKAKEIVAQAASAVAHAHDCGVTHRDIKPENIFVLGDLAKVGDWGLSRSSVDKSGLTKTGFVVGTPGYMAPETVLETKLNPACDVYALGCILYEVAHDCPLFKGKTPLDTLRAHLNKERPKITKGDTSFRQLLANMVAYDHKMRPTAEEVFHCLSGDGVEGATLLVERATASPKRPNWLLRFLTVSLIVIFILLAHFGTSTFEEGNLGNVRFQKPARLVALEQEYDSGSSLAAFQLGQFYSKGKFTSERKALEYFEEAVRRGERKAAIPAGKLLEKKKPSKALEYFIMAGENGSADGAFWAGEMYYRNGKQHNHKLAKEWFERALQLGDIRACGPLGDFYEEGILGETNIQKALELFRKGAAAKDPYAMTRLGRLYEAGKGVVANNKRAFKLHFEAAKSGNHSALINLGKAYEIGSGTQRDPNKAFSLYKRALDNGMEYANFRLGLCYEKGTGVEKDVQKAFEYYKISAERYDITSAWYRLGLCHEKGSPIKKDLPEAVRCYEKAFAQGHSECRRTLADCLMKIGTPESIKRAKMLRKDYEQDMLGSLLQRKGILSVGQ